MFVSGIEFFSFWINFELRFVRGDGIRTFTLGWLFWDVVKLFAYSVQGHWTAVVKYSMIYDEVAGVSAWRHADVTRMTRAARRPRSPPACYAPRDWHSHHATVEMHCSTINNCYQWLVTHNKHLLSVTLWCNTAIILSKCSLRYSYAQKDKPV